MTTTTVTPPTTFGLVRWLTSITHPVHKPLFVSAALRCVNLVLEMMLFGLAAGCLVSLITDGGRPLPVFIALVAVSLGKALGFYLEQFTGHYVAFKALELLRTYVFSKLWPKAPAIVTHSRSGDILTSLTRDVDRIEVFYAHTFAPLVAAVVSPVVVLVGAGIWAGWDVVAIPALCVLLSLTLIPAIGARAALRTTRTTLAQRRNLTHHISDSVFGTEEVVSYGRQAERFAGMERLEEKVAASAATPRNVAGFRRGANVLLMMISVISIIWVGLSLDYPIAVVAGLAAGALRLFEGPRGAEDAVGYLDHSFASARRLWEISHAPEAVSDGPVEYQPQTAPSVSWTNVSYAYRRPDGTLTGFALKDVTIDVPAGSHTVLVGQSGSGKSTTVQMLLRYDDPDRGTVSLDGTPITEFTLDSLRRAVVVVSQRNNLLNTTIAQNLRLGAPDATDEDLWQALTHVGLDDEVRAMPAGLNTPTGENGSKLSGGQAQRLCVARAILMHPRVLVLDEFTANLNVDLEQQIRRSIAEALPGVTIVEVTHRLESVRDADQIVLLDRGAIVAKGSPREIEESEGSLGEFFHRNV